jgi:hypothetical protein
MKTQDEKNLPIISTSSSSSNRIVLSDPVGINSNVPVMNEVRLNQIREQEVRFHVINGEIRRITALT